MPGEVDGNESTGVSTKHRISVSISDDIDEEVVKDDQSPGPTPDVEEMTLDTRWEQQLLGGGTGTDSNDRKGKRMNNGVTE